MRVKSPGTVRRMATKHKIATAATLFCDGACRGNGQVGAIGGWAWALWTGPAAGEPVAHGAARLGTGPGILATNQRAELTALLEAMRYLQRTGAAATIYTDSMYALNCASKWGPGWKRAAWRRASGEPLQNLDLIKPLVDLWQTGRWPLVHVYGHQKGNGWQAYGNNWVDQAAVAASLGSVVSLTATTYEVPPAEPKPKLLILETPAPAAPAPAPIASPLKSRPVKVIGQSDLRKWFSQG